jgi:hypothetical protein
MLYRPPTACASMPSQPLISARAEPRNRKHRRHRSSRRHFEHGTRRAVLRAFTAAQLYIAGTFPTLAAAAEACGTNTDYIAAAVIVLQTEDGALKAAVFDGTVSLLAAAKAMKQTAKLLAAYRAADGADKFAFARTVTAGAVWDELICPVLDDNAGTNRKEVDAT